MMVNIRYIYTLLTAALLSACATGCVEEMADGSPQTSANCHISFQTALMPQVRSCQDYCFGYLSVQEEDLALVSGSAETKSAPKTSLNGLEASVSAYIYDTWDETASPEVWDKLTEKKFVFRDYFLEAETDPVTWKSAASEAGATMRVYAVSPCGLDMGVDTDLNPDDGIGIPTIDYKVDTDPSKQAELLVAVAQVQREEFYHNVPLEFQHALTAVRFKMGFACSVESIVMEGICTEGTLTLGTSDWVASGEKTFTLSFAGGKSFKEGEIVNDGDDIYMMIPQMLGTNASLTLTYDGGKTLSADLSGVRWDHGKLITYTLNETVQYSTVQYFDLAAGDVSIKPSGYSGYVYVGGVATAVKGPHVDGNMYYVYQSSESQTATNAANTGWETQLRVGKCRIPEYERVEFNGQKWSDYITNNPVVEDVIENWDNEAGTAGAVRSVGRAHTPYYIDVAGEIKCNLTIDNLYSRFQQASVGRTKGGVGFIPSGTGSYLSINIVGDNRFGAIHYSNTVMNNGCQLIFTGTGSLTVADVDYKKSKADSQASVVGDWEYGYYSNHWCAAIGNNDSSDQCYGIVFEGGVVFAGTTKAENCSAIGGGGNGNSTITIKGGDITAVASTTGTAIGGGIGFNSQGGAGTVTISGGNVYAYNKANRWDIPSSAIGGAGSKAKHGNSGTVTITGGNVYAQSAIGTAIGGGSSYNSYGGGAVIKITGGHVVARSVAAESGLKPGVIIPPGAGIGGGTGCTSGSVANLNGGSATVTIEGSPVIRTGSIGGGHTNSPGGKIGTAKIYVRGGDIQAQFIMENTGSGLEEDRPVFEMNGGVIRNSDVDDPDYYHVQRNGGAVYMSDGIFSMVDGVIKDCFAESGGAVYIKGVAKPMFSMTGGTISGCRSEYNGGAIYLEDGKVNLGGTGIITSCEGRKGGAICILKTSSNVPTFTMTSGTVAECSSVSDGGAVYLEGGLVTVSGGEISDNISVGGNGGGVSIATGNFIMPEGGTASITGNTALIDASKGGSGGGIYVSSVTSDVFVDVFSGEIMDNTADRFGGGLCVDMSESGGAKADVVVGVASGADDSPMISHNKSLLQGGGLYVVGHNASIEINSGTILGNTTSAYVANEDVANELGMVTLNGGQVTHVVVTFHGNGGYLNGADTAVQNIVTATNSVLVQPATINRAGYRFLGWHTRADGDDNKGKRYANGDVMNLSASLDLYAQWELQ